MNCKRIAYGEATIFLNDKLKSLTELIALALGFPQTSLGNILEFAAAHRSWVDYSAIE